MSGLGDEDSGLMDYMCHHCSYGRGCDVVTDRNNRGVLAPRCN